VGVERVVADKGYHSKESVRDLTEVGVKTVISEPERNRQQWNGQAAEQAAVYANRRRLQTATGKALLRRRGEFIERSFAHAYETGGMRRVYLRKKNNIAKRVLIHVAAFNLSLILRVMMGVGTARQATELAAAFSKHLFAVIQALTTPNQSMTTLNRMVSAPSGQSVACRRCRHRRTERSTLSTGC
jgi:hypothetical protein